MATMRVAGGRARIRVWDLPLRLFHWLLVVAIAMAFLSSEEDSALNDWHVLSGWVAGILIVFRVAWGFVGGQHSRFVNFLTPAGLGRHLGELRRGRPEPTLGHNPLGAVSVLVLLALAGATVWTGVILIEDLHEVLAWTLLALVGVHVAAVVIMSFLTRENLVGAMVSGTKPAVRHPGAADARPPRVMAVAVAIAVVAGAIYAVRAYDPLAFTLRSAEAYEHRTDTGFSGRRGGEGDEREGEDHDS